MILRHQGLEKGPWTSGLVVSGMSYLCGRCENWMSLGGVSVGGERRDVSRSERSSSVSILPQSSKKTSQGVGRLTLSLTCLLQRWFSPLQSRTPSCGSKCQERNLCGVRMPLGIPVRGGFEVTRSGLYMAGQSAS